jgi:hypothetical protein
MAESLNVFQDHAAVAFSVVTITSVGRGCAQIIVVSGRTPKVPAVRTTQTRVAMSGGSIVFSFV